jgi:hypothetical protein
LVIFIRRACICACALTPVAIFPVDHLTAASHGA